MAPHQPSERSSFQFRFHEQSSQLWRTTDMLETWWELETEETNLTTRFSRMVFCLCFLVKASHHFSGSPFCQISSEVTMNSHVLSKTGDNANVLCLQYSTSESRVLPRDSAARTSQLPKKGCQRKEGWHQRPYTELRLVWFYPDRKPDFVGSSPHTFPMSCWHWDICIEDKDPWGITEKCHIVDVCCLLPEIPRTESSLHM